jgi:hypothetical protein
MKVIKSILLVVFIFAISAPCFGSNDAIKRKKNKWLYSEETVKTTTVNCNSQSEIVSFAY